jgi:hypothetical protein
LGQSTLVVLCAGSTLLLVQSYAPDLAMKEVWELPPDELLMNTGKEWLLHLLRGLSEV